LTAENRLNLRIVFLVGTAFMVFLIGFVLFVPEPTDKQFEIIRIVIAVAAAGVASMIPGFLNLRMGRWLRAGGALAVFAVVYFYSPARWLSNRPINNNTTYGDQSPIIPNNSGSVTIMRK